MSRHPHDLRFSSPAVERARALREEQERARTQGTTGRVRGDRVDLAVLVDDVSDGQIVEVKEHLPAPWVSALVDDQQDVHWSASGDAQVDVTLEREAAFVRLKGSARFALLHPCVRCGQRDVPFDVPLRVDLRLVERAPVTHADHIDADYAAHDDGNDHAGLPLGNAADLEDLDIASYSGDVVAVDQVLREQLFLELPMHPHCKSAGACLQESCGLDEQKAALDAENARFVDPRWAGALQHLKETLSLPQSAEKPVAPTDDVVQGAFALPAVQKATAAMAETPAPTGKSSPSEATSRKAQAAPKPALDQQPPRPAPSTATQEPLKRSAATRAAKAKAKSAAKKPASTTSKANKKKTAGTSSKKKKTTKKKTSKTTMQKRASSNGAPKTAAKKTRKPSTTKTIAKPHTAKTTKTKTRKTTKTKKTTKKGGGQGKKTRAGKTA
jgi:uncharacterized metal-binding protein YceD (DUF177 family)